MKITPEQQAMIDSLYCERLSSNDVNFRLVDGFFNSRNTSISDTLQNEAYQEDETGDTAGTGHFDTAGTGHFVSLGNAFTLEEKLLQEAGNDGRTVNLYFMVQGSGLMVKD